MKSGLLSLPIIIFISFILCFTNSCKPVKEVVENTKIEYRTVLKTDSVIIHDSIDRYKSGDSLIIYKIRYIYKYLNKTDTILKTDTINTITPIKVPETKIKEVNKLKWYQTTFMWIGIIATLIIASFILVKRLRIKYF